MDRLCVRGKDRDLVYIHFELQPYEHMDFIPSESGCIHRRLVAIDVH